MKCKTNGQWKCSQCGKKCKHTDEQYEDGVCESCHEEATKVECPVCEAEYTSEDDIYTENGRTCCGTCHDELNT